MHSQAIEGKSGLYCLFSPKLGNVVHLFDNLGHDSCNTFLNQTLDMSHCFFLIKMETELVLDLCCVTCANLLGETHTVRPPIVDTPR